MLDRYDQRVLIGEIYLPIERLMTYYGNDLGGAHLPFDFQLIYTAWTAHALATLVTEYERALPPGDIMWMRWPSSPKYCMATFGTMFALAKMMESPTRHAGIPGTRGACRIARGVS